MGPTTRHPGLHLAGSAFASSQADTNNAQPRSRDQSEQVEEPAATTDVAAGTSRTQTTNMASDTSRQRQVTDSDVATDLNEEQSTTIKKQGVQSALHTNTANTAGIIEEQATDTAGGSATVGTNKSGIVSMTPNMRSTALKMLINGRPPSSLGTVLPSILPDYLCCLYLGPISQINLFFKSQSETGRGVNVNEYVIYFGEWSVEGVTDRARTIAKSATQSVLATNIDTGDESDTTQGEDFEIQNEAIRRVQTRASRSLAYLRNMARQWTAYDSIQALKEQEALEVIVTDPLTQQSEALENMVGYWRTRLGWIEPVSNYWFDPVNTTLDEQRFRFVAYAPKTTRDSSDEQGSTTVTQADTDTNTGTETETNAYPGYVVGLPDPRVENVRYVWSHASGSWKTADGLAQEREKIQRDRNDWLVTEIGRIERERNDDFVREGAGFILHGLKNLDGRSVISHESALGKWTGGAGMPGQKATKRRRVKKQVPERKFGSVDFVPEDGGAIGLEVLRQATNSQEVQDENNQEDIQENEGALAPSQNTLTPAVDKEIIDSDIEPAGRKGGKGRKGANGRAAGGKGAKTVAGSRNTRSNNNNNNQGSKRKRTPDDEGIEQGSDAPQTKQRKTAASSKVKADEPQPVATRKSSRIAGKRKAEDDPNIDGNDNDNDKGESSKGHAAKKHKSGAKDTREATMSVEPIQPKTAKPAAKPASLIPDSDEPAPLSSPVKPKTVAISKGSKDDGALAGPSTGQPSEKDAKASTSTSASAPTSPTITPRRPTSITITLPASTSITLSPLPPLTANTRNDLMSKYPFLASISDTLPAHPPSSPLSSTDTSSGNSNNNSNNNDTQQTMSACDEWLHFLCYFGRDAGVVDQLNTFFKRDGAVAREREFLGCLKQAVGGIRRVEDAEDGERRYAWRE